MADPFAKDKVLKLESQAAQRKTAESLKYGDDLMEALDLADAFKEEVEQYEMAMQDFREGKAAGKPERPKPSIKFLNRTVFDHVLLRLKAIRSAELENALKFLNFKYSVSLLYYLEHLVRMVSQLQLLLLEH